MDLQAVIGSVCILREAKIIGKTTFAKAGDKVRIVSDKDNVVIVEAVSNGERFSLKKELLKCK